MKTLRKMLPGLRDWLAAPMLIGLLAGMGDVQAEAVRTVQHSSDLSDLSDRSDTAINQTPAKIRAAFRLPFDEALAWFREKGIVDPATFRALDAAARARAFSIAGLTNDYALEVVRDSLVDALSQGLPPNQWLTRLEETMTNAGLSAVGELPAHHLRLVYRQNVYTAYSAGRYTQMQRVREQRPYLQYLTVGRRVGRGRGMVRPEHAALDGAIKRVDDPFWKKYYPPWDFGCRCTVVSLDEGEADELGGPTQDGEIAQRYGNLMPSMGPQLPRVRPGFEGDPAERFFLNRGPAGMEPTEDGRRAYELMAGGRA